LWKEYCFILQLCKFLILSITTSIAAIMLNIDFRTTIIVNMLDFIFNEPHRLCNYKFVPCSVDGGFEPHLCQTKYYKIGISCFSAKQAAFGWGGVWRKIKVSWVQNQDNVSEWGNTSTC
jgi:hypothetical protein